MENRGKKMYVCVCVFSESLRWAKPADLSTYPYGCSTMWLCGAKVFQHHFIAFQHLRATVTAKRRDFQGRNQSDRAWLKFPVSLSLPGFCPLTFAADVFGFDCDPTDPLKREKTSCCYTLLCSLSIRIPLLAIFGVWLVIRLTNVQIIPLVALLFFRSYAYRQDFREHGNRDVVFGCCVLTVLKANIYCC